MGALTTLESSPTLRTFRKDFDRFFDDFWGEKWPAFLERKAIVPPVEVGETGEEVFVNAQVPGFAKENLSVQMADGTLTIKGDVKEEKEEKKKNFYRQEFRCESFIRTVPLPEEVDATKTMAELDKGVLRIHLPKTEKAKMHSVNVPVK